jgi:hypothetical protein
MYTLLTNDPVNWNVLNVNCQYLQSGTYIYYNILVNQLYVCIKYCNIIKGAGGVPLVNGGRETMRKRKMLKNNVIFLFQIENNFHK